MELRHIRYFLAVADEGSFTRAAERLGIAQPPLSQQIRALEQELGVLLFRRVPRGAVLSDAGQAFYREVQGLPLQVDLATREAQFAARGETGALRVGFTGAAGLYPVVQDGLRRFRRQYPQVELSLEEANTSLLIRRLEERVLDVAFIRATEQHAQDFAVRQVAREPMVAVLPAEHPLAVRGELALSDLRGEAFILTPRHVGPSSYDTVVLACRAAGFEPILGQLAPQMLSVISLVSVGLGVSVVPGVMRSVQLTGSRFLDVLDGPVIDLSVAHRRDNHSKVLDNFLDLVNAHSFE